METNTNQRIVWGLKMAVGQALEFHEPWRNGRCRHQSWLRCPDIFRYEALLRAILTISELAACSPSDLVTLRRVWIELLWDNLRFHHSSSPWWATIRACPGRSNVDRYWSKVLADGMGWRRRWCWRVEVTVVTRRKVRRARESVRRWNGWKNYLG